MCVCVAEVGEGVVAGEANKKIGVGDASTETEKGDPSAKTSLFVFSFINRYSNCNQEINFE